MAASLTLLTPDDLATDQEAGWCPGCGDFSILAQLKIVLAGLGVPREKIVFVSGVGCSSRLPHFLNTYGFQTTHGQALSVATGIKLANPDLHVWVVLGDGDALGAGGNHLLHTLRRNVDVKILLLNNEVFGQSRGHHSPTSRIGTRTRSSPDGSFETPLRPLSVALAAEASFVARALDVDVDHLGETLQRAAAHRGTAFVEIYQNCKVFNDGVFEYATDQSVKADNVVFLEHGKPLVFGKDGNRGIRIAGTRPEIVTVNGPSSLENLVIHDEQAAEPMHAFLLSRLVGPEYPEAVGVLRCVERPPFEELLLSQIARAREGRSNPYLAATLAGDDSWKVE